MDYSDDDDNDSKKNTQSSGAGLSLVMFILNVIIIQNTTRSGFEQVMPYGDEYYSYHLYMMWASIGMMIMYLMLLFMGCCGVVNKSDGFMYCAGACSVLFLVGLLVVIILQFVKMGELWDKDPEHTMPWYKSYWSEGITHFPTSNITHFPTGNSTLRGGNVVSSEVLKHWPYDMSDVVVRIYGFLLMVCSVIFGLLAFCGGCAFCMSQTFSSRDENRSVVHMPPVRPQLRKPIIS